MKKQNFEGPPSATVLVVDDEKVILALAREILGIDRIRVLSANSGEEAIQLYKAHGLEIDLVILDLVMPGIDGRTTFLEMKKIHPEIKVLFSSGYAHEDQPSDLIDDSILGFIRKPYDINEFLDKTRTALEKSKQIDDAPPDAGS